jgi:hypothetical protein
MSFYRVNDVGILYSLGGAYSVDFSTPEPPPPSGAVAPALTVEYVDGSGVRYTSVVVDGVTTISGVAPLLVQFDASASRVPTAFADQSAITDEAAHAYLMAGYRLNCGEGSGAYAYPVGTAYPRNEETGPPLFAHIYRTAGTHTARLKVRDALGNESTLALSVVVSAAPAATHIPVSDGAWPTWANNTRYTLQAGGDYRAFGQINTGGRHNIIIEKTGSGADPRIGTFTPDGRSKFDAVALAEYRASHIRLVNIDMDSFDTGQRGFDYVGIIGGLVRNAGLGAQDFLWTEGSEIVRSNCRYGRGLFVEDAQMQSGSTSSGFVLFGAIKGFHARNTQFRHMVNGPTTYLMLRLYGTDHSIRNCLWFSEANGGSANGLPLGQFAIPAPSAEPAIVWRSDDMVGPLTGSTRYALISERQVVQHSQVHAEGSFLTNSPATVGSEGGLGGDDRIRPRLMGWEDCVFYPTGDVGILGQTADVRAQHGFWRNVRRDMGAGTPVGATTAQANDAVGDQVTFAGPKLIETTNSRPVPTGFA